MTESATVDLEVVAANKTGMTTAHPGDGTGDIIGPRYPAQRSNPSFRMEFYRSRSLPELRSLVAAKSPRVGKDVPLNDIEAALPNRSQIFFSPTWNVKRNPRSFVMCR